MKSYLDTKNPIFLKKPLNNSVEVEPEEKKSLAHPIIKRWGRYAWIELG